MDLAEQHKSVKESAMLDDWDDAAVMRNIENKRAIEAEVRAGQSPLAVAMEVNAWRAVVTGLCMDFPKSPEDARNQILARIKKAEVRAEAQEPVAAQAALIEKCDKALRLVQKYAPITLDCEAFHHPKSMQHDSESTCDPAARYCHALNEVGEIIAAIAAQKGGAA